MGEGSDEYLEQKKSNLNNLNRKSTITISRGQLLKNQSFIYPQSSGNKIVFVSNIDGNAFAKQRDYDIFIPSHIDISRMIKRVNRACYDEWKYMHQFDQKEPLLFYDYVNLIISVITVFLIIVHFANQMSFIHIEYINDQNIAFFLVFLIGSIIICSIFVISQKRATFNKDLRMIKAIKKQLHQINNQEQEMSGPDIRFIWTCHKSCLWIACKIL